MSKVVVWLQQIVKELDIIRGSTVIMQENANAMKWAPGHPAEDFRKSKHIQLRYHRIREFIRSGEAHMQQISTGQMAADCPTKPLSAQEDKKANDRLQLVYVQSLADEE